jgi:TPR repeat protein
VSKYVRPQPIALISALMLGLAQPAQAGFFNNSAYLSANKADESGDYTKAAKLYVKVVEGSSPELAAAAAYKLYQYYLNGMGAPKNPDAALHYLAIAAQSTNPTWAKIANWQMGYQLMTGLEGTKAVKRIEAVPFLIKARDLGDQGSAKALEILQLFPEVILASRTDLFSQPSEQIAPFSLAAAFQFLNSGDVGKARSALNWHARRGNEQAQVELALLLLTKGTPEDLQEAGGWFFLAARSGNADAQRFYGLLLMEIAKAAPPEALEWLQRSADQGDPDAENSLGQYAAYPPRNYSQPNYTAAANHFQKAMSLGSTKAAINLGNLFAEGLGVQQSTPTAIDLYKAAADAGSVEARNLLFSKFNIVYNTSSRTALTTAQKLLSRPTIAIRELSPVEIYQRHSQSVFKIEAGTEKSDDGSQGSAVAIDSNMVITNCHVTDGMMYYGIVKDEKINAMIDFKSNKEADLCIYKTKERVNPIAEFRSYETLQVGEKVYAIGSPKGLENTLSEGIVSALRLDGRVRSIQVTAPIAPGSSGGALFDAQGRLIGITTSGVEGAGNLNFAVSIDEAP